VQVSFQELAENIGVSKSSAQAAVSWLGRRKLLSASKANTTSIPYYRALTPWKDASRPKSARSR
jgi:predicted transcriptional regulator